MTDVLRVQDLRRVCGKLLDVVAELHALLRPSADDDVLVLWHDLQHLAGVLRLLAYLDLPTVDVDES
ncbi:hypothetical protein [Micromonospora chokoriensis]|uniref:Uncharacterized protein n=1 Tax=Micromonospora chokoriensis TaxID=356851 RepID=A0A1C4Z3Q5_9ACTN|nr:hypothetical protein [Micromonospora chokoriensis]SCF27598.1 hypothetical protein GA0070612_5735 [Micromonospora chokoriensis]